MADSNADNLVLRANTVDIWFIIFSFLSPTEEFGVALVCKMFYDILRTIRQSRGSTKWLTGIYDFTFIDSVKLCYANPAKIKLFLHDDDTRVMNAIKDRAVVLTLDFANMYDSGYYDLLCDILDRYDMDSNPHLCFTVFDRLMRRKQYDVVRKLIKKGLRMPWTEFFCSTIESGQIDLVKHTFIPEYMLGGKEILLAVRSGNMEVLFFMLEFYESKNYTIPYPTSLLSGAIASGNLEMLKYVIGMGARLSSGTVECAFRRQKHDMLEYLVDTGCPIPACVDRALDTLPPKLAEKIKQKTQPTEEPYDSDW